MEKEVKKILKYIVSNYDKFNKSKLDNDEFVIFATGDFGGEYGYGSSDLEGFATNETGKLFWVYASGCSCNCNTGSEEKDLKIFEITKLPDDVSNDLLRMIGLFGTSKEEFVKNVGSYNYQSY